MADSDVEVEEVIVDLAEANQLFQNFLSKNAVSFLERVEKLAADDEEMSDDRTLGPAMEALTKYVLSHDSRDVQNINLFSLTDFGLSVNAMHNVGYLVILMDKANRRRSNGSKVTDDSVEQYDEDFESLENSGRSVNSNTLIIDGQPDTPPYGSSPQAVAVGQRGGSGSVGRVETFRSPLEARASRLDSRGKDKEWISKGHWRMGDKIGSGAFGEVFQGLNSRNGQLFAVKRLKIVPGQAAELENLANEIDLMRTLVHPNIVQYIGTKVDSVNEFVYIFQEWVPGGSVASLLEKFGPFQIGVIQTYTRQILLGLQYLHENGIVHRDIKGGNILVENSGSVKLADFGASAKMAMGETQETATIKGTPYFMAPEVLSQSRYGRKGDVWAVGCTVIQMLTGQPPWKVNNIQNIVQLHMLLSTMKEGPPKMDREVPELMMDFLTVIFKKDPKERPSAAVLLTHPFLSTDDLDDSMGTIGPGGLSLGNRPYRDAEPGSGGSTADLMRLKDSHNSPAYEKFEQAGIGSHFSAEDTMVNIDNEINLRKLASRATTAAAGSRYDPTQGRDSLTDDELMYSDSARVNSSTERDISSRERPASALVVGSRVEACFRGRSKWYPGIITQIRNQGEGYYDIAYDDGETETHVPRQLIRLPVGRKSADVERSSHPNDVISPSNNPFARPGGSSPAAASANPFARQGAVVNPFPSSFSSPPQRGGRTRSNTAAGLVRDSAAGLGPVIPPDNQVSRRGVRTADSTTPNSENTCLPEVAPKAQLAFLKSSISSGNGMNAPKRRGSKGNDVETGTTPRPSPVPVLDMKHSRSEQTIAPRRNGGKPESNAAFTRESPRSNENTPRMLDPLVPRKTTSKKESGVSQKGVEARTRHMAPPSTPAVAVSQVVSQEYLVDDNMWQCMKCRQINPFIPDVDYCDQCSTRRGFTGHRGVSSHVRKYE